LMRNLRVDADHLRMVERSDEAEHRADRRKVDIAARLIRLRLQRKLQIILLVAHIITQEIERLAEAFEALLWVLAGVRLDTLAPTPKDVELGTQFHAKVNRVDRLLQGIRAHLRIIGGKRAILESRIEKEIGRRHR